mmetsp:Transcript_39945/g.96405  ORF Transcript_39945/g.96405 Transcript_39945/m.96405 type:complete len:504 (+) Transcript_39945:2499-4010(+)
MMWYGHDYSASFFPDEEFGLDGEDDPRFRYRYGHLGVKQLFDPTLMRLREYYENLDMADGHVQEFLNPTDIGDEDQDQDHQDQQDQQEQEQEQQHLPKDNNSDGGEWSENYQSTTEHLAASQCLFRSPLCLVRYELGECWDEYSPTNADDYYNMTYECCPICQSVPSLDYLTYRCPRNPTVENPFSNGPGSVTQLFVDMMTKLRQLGLTYYVHATPFHYNNNNNNNNDDGDDENDNDDYDGDEEEDTAPGPATTATSFDNIPDHVARLLVPPPLSDDSDEGDEGSAAASAVEGSSEIKYGPWIVTIEDFVTQDQVDALKGHGERQGYSRSYDGVQKDDGSWERIPVEWRTSGESFCNTPQCLEDPIVTDLMTNVTSTLGIPESHCDYLQLLKYTTGQFYKEHNDYDAHQVFASAGARSITWYMYLSTVPEGGETQFPRIPIKVAPKQGRVLVWSNIRDDDPIEEDLLARHEALPVISKDSLKYGATAWFHSQNIRQVPYHCRD